MNSEKLLSGVLSISRVSSNHGPDTICLRVGDSTSKIEFLEVVIPPEEFALALTGRSLQPCKLELRGIEDVGKRREHTKIEVFVPDGEWEDRATRARQAIVPHEVDGWEGNDQDALNHHLLVPGRELPEGEKGNWYRVGFTRFVDKDTSLVND